MTRRSGRSAANDPGLVGLFQAGTPVITLVGKSSARQAEGALGVTRDENLTMIADSIREARRHADEVMFDAEHFFDGFKEDGEYTLACLEAAHAAGARWIVLCDTNGGTLPHEVERDRRPGAALDPGRACSASTPTTTPRTRSPTAWPRSRPGRGRCRAR